MGNSISWEQFESLDIRTGTIRKAEIFKNARKPAYILSIDFGEIGILRSSAQLTDLYTCEELIGKQVVAVVNFPPKQIANFMSECLVLGAVGLKGEITLLETERKTNDGLRIA